MIKKLWDSFWEAFNRWAVNILGWLENTALEVLKKLVVNAINTALVVADMMLTLELWAVDLVLSLVDLPEFSTQTVDFIRTWWGRFDHLLPLTELVTALNILLAWRLGFFALGYVWKFFFKITLKLFVAFATLRRLAS